VVNHDFAALLQLNQLLDVAILEDEGEQLCQVAAQVRHSDDVLAIHSDYMIIRVGISFLVFAIFFPFFFDLFLYFPHGLLGVLAFRDAILKMIRAHAPQVLQRQVVNVLHHVGLGTVDAPEQFLVDAAVFDKCHVLPHMLDKARLVVLIEEIELAELAMLLSLVVALLWDREELLNLGDRHGALVPLLFHVLLILLVLELVAFFQRLGELLSEVALIELGLLCVLVGVKVRHLVGDEGVVELLHG